MSSPASEANSSVELQWQALQPLLLPHAEVWKSAPRGSTHMVAIVEAIQIFPGITVPVSLMDFLCNVGAELEFDCYFDDEYMHQVRDAQK